MSTQLIPVPFRGTTLFVVSHEGQPYTPMKPIVEGMGLAWQPQHEKLNANKARFCITEIVMQMPGDDQRRNVCYMPLRKLPGWLMTVHPNKVKPAIRDSIIAYQNECDDVLWQYWTQGQSIKPASKPRHLPRKHYLILQAEVYEVAKWTAQPGHAKDALWEHLREIGLVDNVRYFPPAKMTEALAVLANLKKRTRAFVNDSKASERGFIDTVLRGVTALPAPKAQPLVLEG